MRLQFKELLHMVKDVEDTYVLKNEEFGIVWMDADELILILAKPHSADYVVKELDFNYLTEDSERDYFYCLWNDTGSPELLNKAYNTLSELARIVE